MEVQTALSTPERVGLGSTDLCQSIAATSLPKLSQAKKPWTVLSARMFSFGTQPANRVSDQSSGKSTQ